MAESEDKKMQPMKKRLHVAVGVDIEGAAKHYPKHAVLLRTIAPWIREHIQQGDIDPRQLARAFSNFTAFQLAEALNALVEAGYFRQVYRIVAPNGELDTREFEDPDQIPDSLLVGDHITKAGADFVPILKPSHA